MARLKSLVTTEDWWTVWIGAVLLASVFTGIVDSVPTLSRWSSLSDSIPAEGILPLLILLVSVAILTGIAVRVLDGNALAYTKAFPVIFVLGTVAFLVGTNQVMAAYGLGYALWALVIGLVVSNLIGTPDWLKPGMRTELFIKTGLVVLGAEVIFGKMLTLGRYGIVVAWGVTPIVLLAMFWFGRRVLRLPPSFAIIVAAATSVCGVSAAIAAAGASRARKDELTLAVGMTLIFTVLMMVFMPLLAQWIGLDPVMAGAWIGGTVDSTGAVAAAGEFLGPEALQTAAVIKMIQNLLIGIMAFGVALYWVARVEPSSTGRPRLGELWTRFPKFVLGFIGASFVVSIVLVPLLGGDRVDEAIDTTSDFRSWFFCLAFLSIGLESDFRALGRQMARGRPLLLYLTGQTFNVLLTLLVVWLVFSGVLFEIPDF